MEKQEEDTASESSSEPSCSVDQSSGNDKQVGRILWKLLLAKRRREQGQLLGRHESASSDFSACDVPAMLSDDDCLVLEAMGSWENVDEWAATMWNSIVVMDGTNEACQAALELFPGAAVSDISDDLITAIKRHTPDFHARVGDFNENLSYAMQSKGLSNLIVKETENCGTESLSSTLKDILQNELETTLAMALGDIKDDEVELKRGMLEYQGSFMRTEETIPQPPHVDFEWDILDEQHNTLRITFFPLTDEGMFIQVWPKATSANTESIPGILVFVPQGKLLCMPSDTIHGGGFQSCPDNGNLRFHLYVASPGTSLPEFQNNRYTEPDNKSKELCERYHNHPQMEKLCRMLFS